MTDLPVRVRLVGKPDCHLCEDAETVVAAVCTELGIGWDRVSITADPALADAYWELIPVVLVDGVRHDYWQIDPQRLRTALTAPSR
ncbi:MAG TPA: glutaredoxin family protein [Candidatus Nanopelagicales bacterium]|nr:glutaredoxin family protein [Candidatus Nanopelagicales bacterium]